MNEAYYKRTYDIDAGEYNAIGVEQGWLCAICQKPLRHGRVQGLRAELDHAHFIKNRRASIRGLLCGGRFAGCNRRLGRMDNIQWLENVLAYLKNPPAQRVLRKNDKT